MKKVNELQGFEEVNDSYLITTCGKLLNKTKESFKILKGTKGKDGYIQGTLTGKNRYRKQYKRHRLVGLAYIENPENKEQINHINECKTDNYLNNLEWSTAKENSNHGTHNQRSSKSKSNEVLQLDDDLNVVGTFKNLKDATEKTKNKSLGSLGGCCLGKTKFYNGFIWKYKKDFEDFKKTYNKKNYAMHSNQTIVKQYDKKGNLINTFNSYKEVQEAGYGREYVRACCEKKRKDYKGYIWEK